MNNYRVHWLLFNLPLEFKNAYRLRYDYYSHNYFFYRNKGYSVKDCFIVIRSSDKCFKVMYVNTLFNKFVSFSSRSSKRCSKIMYNLFQEFG